MSDTTRKLTLEITVGTDGWRRKDQRRVATFGRMRGIGATIPAAVEDLRSKIADHCARPRYPHYVFGPTNSGLTAVLWWDEGWHVDVLSHNATFSSSYALDNVNEVIRRVKFHMAQRCMSTFTDEEFEDLALYLDNAELVEELRRDFGFQRAYKVAVALGNDDPFDYAVEHRDDHLPNRMEVPQ